MSKFDLHLGNCLDVLKGFPAESVDSIVTDPPYGLSFMAKKWDYDVPGTEIWAECLRVLKPEGNLLCFAGTRTQHRMVARVVEAGFELQDMVLWTYGCLSEDSEVLTKDGWVQYHRAMNSEVLSYDVERDIYKWERPQRWYVYSVESDTAFRIRSDKTDQIVSRGHRCLVEREGKLVFVRAEELSGMEVMPTLQSDFFLTYRSQKRVNCSRECNGHFRGQDWAKHGHKGRSGWTEESWESCREKMTGPGNPAWKGGLTYFKRKGKYADQSIKYVRCPEEYVEMARKDGYVMEHRLIVAQEVGRPLLREECVHHINHDATDNRLENLMLFASNADHKRYEHGQAIEPLWQPSPQLSILECSGAPQ